MYRLHLALLLDQEETINASAAKFTSYENMVDRLLPWHVWQIHDEELEVGKKSEGARGGAIAEKEKVDAANIVGRIKTINQRFGTLRRREGNVSYSPNIELIFQPNRKTLDILSLINMTKDSMYTVRSDLNPLQTQLAGLEAQYKGHLEAVRRADIERRRLADEEEKKRLKILEEAKKAKDAQDAREANEAAVLKMANERKIAAAVAAAKVAASPVASTSTPAAKGKAVASVAAGETPESSSGKLAVRGKGRPRGGKAGPSLRETVLTQQSTSTPGSPAPLTPSTPATTALKPVATPSTPSPAPLPAMSGPSTPASVPTRVVPPRTASAHPTPTAAAARASQAKAPITNGTPITSNTNTPVTTTRPAPPTPNALGKAGQQHITLVMKLTVLPQLIRLGILAMPQHAKDRQNAPQATHPAVIKGPVPNSTAGDVYLQV